MISYISSLVLGILLVIFTGLLKFNAKLASKAFKGEIPYKRLSYLFVIGLVMIIFSLVMLAFDH